jgi:hypothetical protein
MSHSYGKKIRLRDAIPLHIRGYSRGERNRDDGNKASVWSVLLCLATPSPDLALAQFSAGIKRSASA